MNVRDTLCSRNIELATNDIKAFFNANQMGINNEFKSLIYRALAIVEGQKGNYKKSISSINKSLEIAKNINLDFSKILDFKDLKPKHLNIDLIEAYLTKIDICLQFKKVNNAEKTLDDLKKIAPNYSKIFAYSAMIDMEKESL